MFKDGRQTSDKTFWYSYEKNKKGNKIGGEDMALINFYKINKLAENEVQTEAFAAY